MNSAFIVICFSVILIIIMSRISALPVTNKVATAEQAADCNDMEEVFSNDPCKPLCACKNGRLTCAELSCSSKEMQHCRKVPTNGKCCPSYLCINDEGVGELHYPLPQLYLPPELGITGNPNLV